MKIKLRNPFYRSSESRRAKSCKESQFRLMFTLTPRQWIRWIKLGCPFIHRNRRVYTDKDLQAHEWFEWWTKEELEQWKAENSVNWHARAGAPNLDPPKYDAIQPEQDKYKTVKVFDNEVTNCA